jgi:hypothetical protein
MLFATAGVCSTTRLAREIPIGLIIYKANLSFFQQECCVLAPRVEN